MRGYIISMSVAAIFASVLEIYAPKEWEKYVRLALGLIILSVILSPISALRKEKLSLDMPTYQLREEAFYDKLALRLKENVERDIEERIMREFKLEIRAKVDISVDDEHNIKGVNAIRIYSRKNPPGLRERLEEIYGCKRVEIVP